MYQLWTATALNQLPFSLQKEIYFYAPLLDSLEFYGTDPVTYTRPGVVGVVHRMDRVAAAGANVPLFSYLGETQLGLWITAATVLQYNTLNTLDDSDTLIWFEDGVAKSTPTNTNPFNAGGQWSGNVDIYVKHIIKARRVLANSEIQQIQSVLTATVPVIPEPPEPPVNPTGSFVTETPAHVGGAVYELSQNPDLNSLLVAAHGGLFLKRVGATPGNMEFVSSGAGGRTLTLGLAPSPASNIVAQYVISA
jgi:hypothetical protein